MKTNLKPVNGRRQFLSKSLTAGATYCLGCSYLFPGLVSANEKQPAKDFNDKINLNAERTFYQLFTFAYRDTILPQLIALSDDIGRDKLVEMLKKATDKVCSVPGYENRLSSSMPKDFWNNVLDIQVLEDTPKTRIYKITNCLWAKVFREAKAEDFGYALSCYGDYAIARTANETLERNKTLMLGHDCCLLKWTKNG